MRAVLDDCRRLLGPAPRRFGILDYAYLQVEPPEWLVEDSLLYPVYPAQKLLRAEGEIVWGVMPQANSTLFDPKLRGDSPASLLYSTDPAFDDDLPTLWKLARELFARKGTKDNGPLQPFVDIITDEHRMDLNDRLPDVLTGGRAVFHTSMMVHRRHLPTNALTFMFLPLLIAPTKTPSVMPLPARFWPDDLVSAWVNDSLDALRPGFPRMAEKGAA